MVTINLLPWRTATHAQRRKRRLWLQWAASLLVLSGTGTGYAIWKLSSLTVAAPVTLPSSLSPSSAMLAADRGSGFRQGLVFLPVLLTPAPTLKVTRCVIQPDALLIEGNTLTLDTWLHWQSHLQHHANWHIRLLSLHTAPVGSGLTFTATLTPRTPVTPTAAHTDWNEISYHTTVLHHLLDFLPSDVALHTLQLPDESHPVAILQARGALTSLLRLAQPLVETQFVCPISRIQFSMGAHTSELLLKWRFPCFQQSTPSVSQARVVGWIEKTNKRSVLQVGPDHRLHKTGDESSPCCAS